MKINIILGITFNDKICGRNVKEEMKGETK